MEKWERPPSHRRGGRDNPSFSSSLLDAIYRSIDESERSLEATAREKQRTGGAPDPSIPSATAAVNEKPVVHRRKHDTSGGLQYNRHHHHHRPILTSTTSSSSDGSSSGGFFSSDVGSSSSSSFSRPKPIRTAVPPIRPDRPPPPSSEKKKPGSNSIRSRIRDLRKARAAGSAPASPGARLASFLNAIFSGAGRPKKAKISSPATAAAPIGVVRRGDESACSSATSYTRSCLSKTPPSGGRSGAKRTVRFGPVSVVAGGDDLRPRGRKSFCYHDGDLAVAGAAAGARARERESRRMVEELLRGLGAAIEEDDDGGGAESDSSSDLFELENLGGGGGGRRYRDELPVYETTHLATNRAIAQGLMLY